jgi:hypothetical protein
MRPSFPAIKVENEGYQVGDSQEKTARAKKTIVAMPVEDMPTDNQCLLLWPQSQSRSRRERRTRNRHQSQPRSRRKCPATRLLRTRIPILNLARKASRPTHHLPKRGLPLSSIFHRHGRSRRKRCPRSLPQVETPQVTHANVETMVSSSMFLLRSMAGPQRVSKKPVNWSRERRMPSIELPSTSMCLGKAVHARRQNACAWLPTNSTPNPPCLSMYIRLSDANDLWLHPCCFKRHAICLCFPF